MRDGALATGFPEEKTMHIRPKSISNLYKSLSEQIQPDTAILVKGASRLNMYDIVQYLQNYYSI